MLVKPIAVKNGDLYLIPGDIHFDKQDDEALELMLKVSYDFGVNGVLLIGDTFNSAGISRHGRPTRKFRFGKGTIKSEAAAASPYFNALNSLVRGNRNRPGGLHVLTGNHDGPWWSGVQDEYPGLLDTPWYELYGDLFDGWHVHEEYMALKLGPLLVCHGHRLRGSLAKYSAASVLANYPGQNTLYGHTHRIDQATTPTHKYGAAVQHGAWTIGHMCDPLQELKDSFLGPHSERHQQGFALVSFHTTEDGIRFSVNQVVIHRKASGAPYCVAAGEMFT